MYQLESGILPKNEKRAFGQLKYPWDIMKPGDSFILSGNCISKNGCITSGKAYFSKKNIPAKLIGEKVSKKEYRIFRVE